MAGANGGTARPTPAPIGRTVVGRNASGPHDDGEELALGISTFGPAAQLSATPGGGLWSMLLRASD